MNCRQAERYIPDYRDLEKGSYEKGELERHLEVCGNCRKSLKETVLLLEKSREVSPPAIDDSYWTVQLDKISSARRVGTGHEGRHILAYASIFVVVFSLGILLLQRGPEADPQAIVEGGNIPLLNYAGLAPYTEEELLQIVDHIDEEDAKAFLDILYSDSSRDFTFASY